MAPVANTYTNPTGFQNVLASINEWLTLNVPANGSVAVPSANAGDFYYDFLADADTAKFPRVSVSGPIDNPEPGVNAMGQVVFPSGAQEQGRPNVIMLEVNIYTDSSIDDSAKKLLYQIRDRLARGLANAGISKDLDDSVILPPIAVLDYDTGPPTDTGIVATVQIESANGLGCRYFVPTAEAPTVHRIQMMARVNWYELS